MGRPSSIDAATARRLDQALQEHHGNVRAAARELGLSKDAVGRYVARRKQAGDDPTQPPVQDQVNILASDLLRIRADLDALYRRLKTLSQS